MRQIYCVALIFFGAVCAVSNQVYAFEFENYGQYKKALKTLALPQKSWIGQDGNWLARDRKTKKKRFYNANAHNILQANGYENYNSLPQRAAFYDWLQLHNDQKNVPSKWCGIAAKTVEKLNLTLIPFARWVGISDKNICFFVKSGNKLILDDVWQTLQVLYKTPMQTAAEALAFDGKLLLKEQILIQNAYLALPPKSLKRLEKGIKKQSLVAKIASSDPAFVGDLLSINERWAYGMQLMNYAITAQNVIDFQ